MTVLHSTHATQDLVAQLNEIPMEGDFLLRVAAVLQQCETPEDLVQAWVASNFSDTNLFGVAALVGSRQGLRFAVRCVGMLYPRCDVYSILRDAAHHPELVAQGISVSMDPVDLATSVATELRGRADRYSVTPMNYRKDSGSDRCEINARMLSEQGVGFSEILRETAEAAFVFSLDVDDLVAGLVAAFPNMDPEMLERRASAIFSSYDV